MSALRAVRPPALFPDNTQIEPHCGGLIDALHAEISVAIGIEAALRCPDLDGEYREGVQEIVRMHVERLRALGRAMERVLA
jgi:hypothetical protein